MKMDHMRYRRQNWKLSNEIEHDSFLWRFFFSEKLKIRVAPTCLDLSPSDKQVKNQLFFEIMEKYMDD